MERRKEWAASGKTESSRVSLNAAEFPAASSGMTVPKSLQPRHPVCVIQNTPHRTRHTGHATRSPFPRSTRSSTPLYFSLPLPTTSAKSQPFTQRQQHHASEHLPHLLAADQRHSNAPAPVSPYKTITDPPLALFMDPATTSLISARRRNLSWSLVNAQKACRPFQTSDLQNQASSCSSRTATSSLGVVIVPVGVVVSKDGRDYDNTTVPLTQSPAELETLAQIRGGQNGRCSHPPRKITEDPQRCAPWLVLSTPQ